MTAYELIKQNLDVLTPGELGDLKGYIELKIAGRGDSLNLEIYEMMRKGSKLGAVKMCKERTGMGLKEAKEYCEGIWDAVSGGARFESIGKKIESPF